MTAGGWTKSRIVASPWQAALVITGLTLVVVAVGYVDRITGETPDVTILYLPPLLAGTYLLGLWAGLAGAVSTLLIEFWLSPRTGAVSPIEATVDAILNFLVFALVVFGTDRLLQQLHTIRRIESMRALDLELAASVQQDLIMEPETARTDIEVRSRLSFAREIGGDYYRFIDLAEYRSFLCIADISGKGATAALFTALLDQAIRSGLERYTDLSPLVGYVNRRLHEIVPPNIFVTFFCAIIDAYSCTWINAGHDYPLLWRAADGQVRRLDSPGALPLGVSEELRAAEQSVELRSGDVLLAFTDGVSESPNLFGHAEEDLAVLLSEHASGGDDALTIVEAIWSHASEGNMPARDDIAILCVRKL